MHEKISAHVDARKQEMLDLLREVVDVYAPSSDRVAVNKVGDVFASRLSGMGFSVERITPEKYGDHIVADLDFGLPGPKVLIMGHMDTVEVANPAERRFAIDGEIARGLGVLDMRGGIVAALYALEALLESGERFPGSIRVFLNSDEEPGSPTSRPLLPTVLKGVSAALVCEGGRPGGEMTVERKGCGIFRLKVTGKAAHAGQEPEKGASAIRELIEKVIAIEDLKGGGTTVNCGVIQGGTAPYIIPDHAECAIDVRVPSPEERRRIEKALAQITSSTRIPGTKLELHGGFHRPPTKPIKGTRSLMKLAERHGSTLGLPVVFAPAGGVGDLNNIVDAGVPGIDGLGPIGLGAHSTDEYIEVPSLFSKSKLIALMVRSVLEGEFNPEE